MMAQEEIQFSDFLKEENIVCDLPDISRDEVITQLAVRLLKNEGGFNKEKAITAILEREKLSPTVIAPGIALPHVRLDKLEIPIVAIATSRKGIDFQAPEEEPVNIVILILTPKADPGAYLRVVAALSKVMGAPRMRSRLALCASSKDVHAILAEGGELPPYLSARNVMDPNPLTLAEGDDLATAIEAFCTNRVLDIPIVDEEGDMRGVIAVEDLLTLSLPEHLLWMHDLSSIFNFQPFAEILQKDKETKIADFMRDEFIKIEPETPAIQLAKMFLMHDARQIHVIEEKRLLGVVNIQSFIAQLFWA